LVLYSIEGSIMIVSLALALDLRSLEKEEHVDEIPSLVFLFEPIVGTLLIAFLALDLRLFVVCLHFDFAYNSQGDGASILFIMHRC